MIWDNFCVNTIRDLDVEYIKRAIQIPFLGRFDCTQKFLSLKSFYANDMSILCRKAFTKKKKHRLALPPTFFKKNSQKVAELVPLGFSL